MHAKPGLRVVLKMEDLSSGLGDRYRYPDSCRQADLVVINTVREDMFDFRKEVPPTNTEFRQIADVLISEFQKLQLGPCETLTISVEPNSWVHAQLFIGDRKEFHGETFLVILTYSFLDSNPVSRSIVLKFLDGHRVTRGSDSIMTSTFSKTGWSQLVWELDGWGEWECDHATELIALKKQ